MAGLWIGERLTTTLAFLVLASAIHHNPLHYLLLSERQRKAASEGSRLDPGSNVAVHSVKSGSS